MNREEIATSRRTFTTFPDGWPGTGLLLLRVSTGGALLWHAISLLRDATWTPPTLGAAVVAGFTAMALLLGWWMPLTTVVAAGMSLATAMHWLPTGAGDHEVRLRSLSAGIVSLALFCLGPGACSIDARRYGRREIVIPRHVGSEEP